MILNNIEFFNVSELEEVPAFSGHLLARLPRDMRSRLNQRARFIGRNSTCSEIRFVTDAKNLSLQLATIKNESIAVQPEVKVMCGNFEHSRHSLALDQITTIALSPPDFPKLVFPKLSNRGFAPNIWRIVCSSPSIIFCGLEIYGSTVRPPEPEEKPSFCWLCYGSSITNSHFDGWPSVMGQRLGADVINLGLAGACYVELEVAEHIANRSDWDGVILELGINILSADYNGFSTRVSNMLDAIIDQHPDKPIVLVTPFPSCRRDEIQQASSELLTDAVFASVIRDTYDAYKKKHANIYLIEGSEILDQFSGLTTDCLHPSRFGHAVMGINFASKLEQLFGSSLH